MNIITLDIGGTAVKYGLFFDNNEEFGQFSVCKSDGTEDIQSNLYGFLDNHKADCIAISVPGPFDFKTGTSNMKHKLPSIYGISLKKTLENKFPNSTVKFIHDSTAFAFGVMYENQELIHSTFACIMLGTGIGYVNVVNGKVQLNEIGTPLSPLWNMTFLDGIAEDYISTKSLLLESKEKGYIFENIKEMATFAQNGNDDVLRIFNVFGKNLGKCIEIKRKENQFNQVVIGGQISKSFDLMSVGFQSESDVNYRLVKNPSTCALYGLKAYIEKENF